MKADKPQKKLNSKPQNEMSMTKKKKKITFGLKRQDVDKEKSSINWLAIYAVFSPLF